MSGEARKLHLIEALLKVDDEKVLSNLEELLSEKPMTSLEPKKSFKDFAGILTHEEALEMKRVIEESCEQIDPNDWK